MEAKADSLTKWINVLDGASRCRSLEDLASGELLLEIMSKIIPELQESTSKRPWDSLIEALEDFCSCDPWRFLSIGGLTSGDVEQIGRVVVLLLCLAVQRPANEHIIAGITSLDPFTQRDIMFYIENTLGQMETHALLTGEFTSGIGSIVPNYEEKEDFHLPKIPQSSSPSASARNGGTQALTPHVAVAPSRLARRAMYNGLASPAAVKWLSTPVIAKKLQPQLQHAPPTEEVMMLRHKVRVLEKRLETESKLAKDFHAELCQMSRDHEYLCVKCEELEKQVKQARDTQDLEDELEDSRQKLSKAEKALTKCQEEVEALLVFKSRCIDQERKIQQLEPAYQSLQECHAKVEYLNAALAEHRAQEKQKQLLLGTVEVQLKIKNEQLEESMQMNAKLSEELKDVNLKMLLMREKETMLVEEKEDIQEKLISMTAVLQDHQQQSEMIKATLLSQIQSLDSELKSAIFTAETQKGQLEVNEHQLTICQQQMEALYVEREKEVCKFQGELHQQRLQFSKVVEEIQEMATVVLRDTETTRCPKDCSSMGLYLLKRMTDAWTKQVQEVSAIQEQHDIAQSSLREARTKLKTLEVELIAARKENDLLTESFDEAQLEVKKSLEEREEMTKSFIEMKNNHTLLEVRLTENMEKALRDEEAAKDALTQAEKRILTLQSELNDTILRCASMEADLKSAAEKESSMQEVMTMVSNQLASSKDDLSDLRKEKEEHVVKFAADCLALQNKNDELQLELQLSLKELAHLKNDLQSVTEQLFLSQKSLVAMETEKEQVIRELQAAQIMEEKSHCIELEKLQQQLISRNHLQSRLSDIQQQLSLVKAKHLKGISTLQVEHEERITRLDALCKEEVAKLQKEHRKNIDHLAREHDMRISRLETEHQKNVCQLEKAHREEIAKILLEHKENVDQIQACYQDKINHLQRDDEEKLQHLEKTHREEIAGMNLACEERIEHLKLTCEKRVGQLQTDYVERLDKLQAELTIAKSEQQEVLEKLQQYFETTIAVKEQLSIAEQDIASEIAKSQSIQAKLDGEIERRTDMEAKNAELCAVKEQLFDRLAELKSESETSLQKYQSESETSLQKYQTQVAEICARLEDAEEQNMQLHHQLEDITEQRHAVERKLSQVTSALQKELKATKDQLSEETQQKGVLEEHLRNMKQRLLKAKMAEEEKEELKVTLDKETEKRSAIEMKFTDLEAYLAVLEHEKSGLEHQTKEHFQNIRRLQDEVVSNKQEVQLANETKFKLQMETADLQRQVTMVNQVVAELRLHNRNLQDGNTRLREHRSEVERELEDVRKQLDQVKMAELTYGETVAKLKAETSSYKDEILNLTTALTKQSVDNQQYCSTLQNENCSLLMKQKQLYDEMQKLQMSNNELESLCQQHKDALQSIHQLSEDMVSAKRAKDELEMQVRQLRQSLINEQQVVKKLTLEKSSLTAEINYASQKLREKVTEPDAGHKLHPMKPCSQCQQRNASASAGSQTEEFSKNNLRDDEPSCTGLESKLFDGAAITNTDCTATSLPLKTPLLQTEVLSGDNVHSMLRSRPSSSMSSITEEDSAERIRELQRRNKKTLPHLKSSYPIELQVQPDSPSISDECIKLGTHVALRSQPQSTCFDIPNDEFIKKRSLPVEKTDVPNEIRSPVMTKRRLSAPHTPTTASTGVDEHAFRRMTMAGQGMKLREFLDKENNKGAAKEQHSSAFEVSVSNACPKPQLPKRLLQRQEARMQEKKSASSLSLCTSSSTAAAATSKKGFKKPKALISAN